MKVQRKAILYMQHSPHITSFYRFNGFLKSRKVGLMDKVRVKFVKEQFGQEGRIFFVNHGYGNVEWIGTDTNAEEDNLNGWQCKLEEKDTMGRERKQLEQCSSLKKCPNLRDVTPETSKVLPKKSRRGGPVFR